MTACYHAHSDRSHCRRTADAAHPDLMLVTTILASSLGLHRLHRHQVALPALRASLGGTSTSYILLSFDVIVGASPMPGTQSSLGTIVRMR